MRYLKFYEHNFEDSYYGIKKGDIVIYSDPSKSRLKYGERYIVYQTLKIGSEKSDDIITNEVNNSSDVIQLTDMSGNFIRDKYGEIMLFYAHRFSREIPFMANKYNI